MNNQITLNLPSKSITPILEQWDKKEWDCNIQVTNNCTTDGYRCVLIDNPEFTSLLECLGKLWG